MNLCSLGLLGVCAILVGCSSAESPSTDVERMEAKSGKPVFADRVINVDQSFSDLVTVEKDSLVIPTSKLGTIAIGSVVAGDRSAKGTRNPFGFLRKVTNIETRGAKTTLETEKAELSEWMVRGRLELSNTRSVFSDKILKGNVATKSLHLLGDDKKSSGAGEGSTTVPGNFEDKINVQNVNIGVWAWFDGYIDVHSSWGIPHGADFRSQLQLQPSLAAEIVWKISNDASVSGEIPGTELLIPLATPIPMTVRYKPVLKCSLSASGEAELTVGLNIGAKLDVGFEGGVGFDGLEGNNLSKAPELSGTLEAREITGKAELTTRCEVIGTVELLAFDAVGMSGSFAPWVEVTATACARADVSGTNAGFTVYEKHGFTESLSAKVQVPAIGASKDFELWSGTQTIGEGNIFGDPETCNLPIADSCAGKPDGFYCSQMTLFSGYVCETGQIKLGHNCETEHMKCVSGTPDRIRCQ